jgi:hypothetical protein
MFGYLPIKFIEDKIRDLQSALFFSLNDAVLKFPTCLIKVLETDELGQLWFLIPKPQQFIHAFDKTFPVKLDFFRKGREYYLKIIGKAFLVNDPEEINSIECLGDNIKQMARFSETVLVKVKISHAEYVEKTPGKTTPRTFLTQVKNKIYHWFQLRHHDDIPDFKKIPAHVTYPSITSFTN